MDILSKCIIVRNIDDYNAFIYKIKEYDEYENIISQQKIECKIDNINDGIKLLNMINYKELLNIKSELIFYSNDKLNILVQIVNLCIQVLPGFLFPFQFCFLFFVFLRLKTVCIYKYLYNCICIKTGIKASFDIFF